MNNLEIGKKYKIHCYKHDGNIHRAWDEAVLLEQDGNHYVFGNDRTKVTESDGRNWRTKEPAVMHFYTDEWYNVIAQLKKDGIYYYCNMASPFIIEEDTIKYIDYDLDLRVFADGTYKVLDQGEYLYHKEKMDYSEKLDYVLTEELNKLIKISVKRQKPFQKELTTEYYLKYKKIKKDKNN